MPYADTTVPPYVRGRFIHIITRNPSKTDKLPTGVKLGVYILYIFYE